MKKNQVAVGIIVFIALWSIAYYFGKVENAAYDGVTDYKDAIALICGFGGIGWVFYKFG